MLCDAKRVSFKTFVRQSHSSWSDLQPCLLPQHIPSLLYPSHRDEQPLDPRTARRPGRFAIQSPLTSCEPNVIVEINSTEVTRSHHPSRRTSFCSVYNSGEDATTTPVSSEVDERQSMGMLASPLLMQKRGAGAAAARIYHPSGESSMSSSPHVRSSGRLAAIFPSSRDPRSVQETHSASETVRTEHQEVRVRLEFRADEAAEGEKAALSRLPEAEFHTRLLLEEQRHQTLPEARSDMNMQELKTESADMTLRDLDRQNHSHRMEPLPYESGV